jgi:hypothetical protein
MLLTRFAVAVAVLVGMAGVANAETVMKQCGEQWQAAKASGTTNGETWPQFLSQCRAQLKGAGSATAPAPAPQQQTGSLFPWQSPTPAATAAPASKQSVMAACGEQWKQAKAAGTTGGATWPQFLKQCRAQMSGGSSASIAPAPIPAPAPPPPASAPAQNGSLFPWSQPTAPAPAQAPAPAPVPANYGAPPSTAGGESAQQVQYRCPGATVVWVNEKSHIYHFPGTHDYGNTKRGAYMCEADAQAAGNRAAKNEHHP